MEEQSKRQLSQYNVVIRWICRVMIAMSAIILAVMMFVSVGDVVGRDFFTHPIKGSYELVGLAVVVIGSLGLGYCQVVRSNISIDIIPNRLGPRGKAVLNIFSYFMSISLCSIICWQTSLRVLDYMSKGHGGSTVTLHIILWPFMLLMDICFLWVGIVYVLDLINSFKELFKR
jgi:TRAP-type C4-dicarboxylate transport system permease small subunit